MENEEKDKNQEIDNSAENQETENCSAETSEEQPVTENECDALQKKIDELNDTYLRLRAEYDNYRKRTIREKADLLKTATEGVFVNILPVIDDFERAQKAMAESEDIDAVREGITLIYNKFVSFLGQNGVKVIETENQPFDTDLHEAITTIPAPDESLKGKIIDCVSKGYTLNDKVIRFPKVVVGE